MLNILIYRIYPLVAAAIGWVPRFLLKLISLLGRGLWYGFWSLRFL